MRSPAPRPRGFDRRLRRRRRRRLPRAIEQCNGRDDDCDGAPDDGEAGPWWPDLDGDGWGDVDVEPSLALCAPDGWIARGLDCDDGEAGISPEATDLPGDGVDADCDGGDSPAPDSDGDGVVDGVDAAMHDAGGVADGSPAAMDYGCGCRTGGAPGPSVPWLLGLGWLARLRRRRGLG